MMLMASSAMISAEDYGGFSGETYKSNAPNGRYSVQAHQEMGYFKFNVEIIERASQKAVATFDPKARFIGAACSPDSKLVAIEQNRNVHNSAVSVFSVGKETAVRVVLPEGCNYEDESQAVFESPTRKHAKKPRSTKFHIALEGFKIEKWLSADDLVLSASGMGSWRVGGAQDRTFLADYKLIIHFAADGTTSLQKIGVEKYEEL